MISELKIFIRLIHSLKIYFYIKKRMVKFQRIFLYGKIYYTKKVDIKIYIRRLSK